MKTATVNLWFGRGWLSLGYAFLYVPIVALVIYSFNDSRLNAEWVGFTFDWYAKLFSDADMLLAARAGLVLLVISCVLGVWVSVARPAWCNAAIRKPHAMPVDSFA